jgi:pantoate--beta-alanine ligase
MTGSGAETTLAIIRNVAALRARVADWRKAGESVALVPTMGALHEGHGALVAAALGGHDRVIVSLFVNPTQFGPGEDYTIYPRDEAADGAFVDAMGVDLLYAPGNDEIYPDGFVTTISVPSLSDVLCGAARPGHFDGVATVVVKLLTQAAPDAAYFGEKDYQQLAIIHRAALDLDLPVSIEGVATVRAPDGLAISSRNVYLNDDERAIAPALHATLVEAAGRIAKGADINGACTQGQTALQAAGFSKVDYFQCVDADTLEPATTTSRPARILAAAHLGRTRLIDNVPVAG